MKMYLDKLNNKPKLKKCLKVLAIVGICLSVIFNGVIIGTAIAQNVNSSRNEKDVQNVVKQTPHRALDYGNYYAYSTTDIYTQDGLDGLIYYLNDYFDTTIWSSDSVGTTNNQLLSDVSLYPSSLEIFSTGTKDNNTGKNMSLGVVSRLQFKVYYFIRGVTQDYDHRYEMKLYDANDLIFLELRWYTFQDRATDDINGLITWCQSFYYPTHGNTSTSTKNGDIFFTTLKTDILGVMFARISNLWGNGYDTGYQRGYDLGYSQGQIDGELSQNSNVFGILANAFGALASVLNIEILPHLTLGLLIFTPVVISIIIVIVKMVRG